MSIIETTGTESTVIMNTESAWYNYSIKFNKGFTGTMGIASDAAGTYSSAEAMEIIEDSIKAGGFKLYERAAAKTVLGGSKTVTSNPEWFNYNLQLSNKVVVTVGIHTDMVADDLTSADVLEALAGELQSGEFTLVERSAAGTRATL